MRDIEGGLKDLVETGATLARDGVPGPAVLPWRADLALALAARGRRGEAERQAREEYRLAHAFGAPRPLGLALRALAAASAGPARVSRCREAVAVLGHSAARLDHAHALCDLGGALRRAGSRCEAREPLLTALAAATSSGPSRSPTGPATSSPPAVHVRAARFGRARRAHAGGAARRRASPHAGLANREIAQALFLTVKTIETELSHAYAKLGIASRRELPPSSPS